MWKLLTTLFKKAAPKATTKVAGETAEAFTKKAVKEGIEETAERMTQKEVVNAVKKGIRGHAREKWMKKTALKTGLYGGGALVMDEVALDGALREELWMQITGDEDRIQTTQSEKTTETSNEEQKGIKGLLGRWSDGIKDTFSNGKDLLGNIVSKPMDAVEKMIKKFDFGSNLGGLISMLTPIGLAYGAYKLVTGMFSSSDDDKKKNQSVFGGILNTLGTVLLALVGVSLLMKFFNNKKADEPTMATQAFVDRQPFDANRMVAQTVEAKAIDETLSSQQSMLKAAKKLADSVQLLPENAEGNIAKLNHKALEAFMVDVPKMSEPALYA